MPALAATIAALAALIAEPAHTDPPRFADAQLATGVRIRYAEQGDPAGHPVILLHGYTDSWFSYSRVMPELARRHRVYALDLRGHGDSDRPAAGYAMRDLAPDVVAFMEAKGVGRAMVVGHSMGSFVAQQVAVAAPERVAGLVLMSSATTMRNMVGIEEFARAVDAMTDPVPPSFAREFQVSTIHHPIPAEFLEEAVAITGRLPARVWRELMAGMLATGPAVELGRNKISTLLLWGEKDALFPRSEQDALLAAIPGSILKVYPETGHALHWERPDKFVRDLEDFVARTGARRAALTPAPR